jgi:hypothetical protein
MALVSNQIGSEKPKTMKLKSLSLVLALPVVLATSLFAQPLATWTFESSVPVTAGPFSPEIGGGSALGFHAGSTVYSSPAGNGSTHSFSSTVWAIGDYYQFQVNTLGYQDITVSYDQTSSGTGPGRFNFSYSTDGVNFTVFAPSYTVQSNAAPNPTWNASTSSSLYTFNWDLSAIDTIENSSTVYFRLVDASVTSAGGGTVATTGTDRVDNFTVNASAIPEPQSFALLTAGGMMLLRLVRPRRQ